ncbi:MAG: hypothetical protein LBI74_03995 [Synergistaceae bacterium]|nr:hypothetical protein [Synergistaceae bacterium]
MALNRYARWNGQVAPFYVARYENVEFLVPVSFDEQKLDAWPEVPTILSIGRGNIIHWEKRDGQGKCFETMLSVISNLRFRIRCETSLSLLLMCSTERQVITLIDTLCSSVLGQNVSS